MKFWKSVVSLSLLAATLCAEGKSLILRNGVDGYQGAEDVFVQFNGNPWMGNQLDSGWIVPKVALHSN